MSDEQIAATIEQWEQHDKFRDFENWGEPLEVRLAKDLQTLRQQLAQRPDLMEHAMKFEWTPGRAYRTRGGQKITFIGRKPATDPHPLVFADDKGGLSSRTECGRYYIDEGLADADVLQETWIEPFSLGVTTLVFVHQHFCGHISHFMQCVEPKDADDYIARVTGPKFWTLMGRHTNLFAGDC